MKRYNKHVAVFATAILSIAVAKAQEFEMPVETEMASTTLTILKIDGKVEVEGIDENVIRLQVEGLKPIPKKAEGLRPLFGAGTDNTGLGLELIKTNDDQKNLVLRQVRRNFGKKVIIQVPEQLAVTIEAHKNRSISGMRLAGEVTARTLNGSMKFSEVRGPILLNTTNGSIDVSISELNQEFPSSIASINGEIDVSIDENEKADLELSVKHGEIYTNLDVEVTQTENGMESLVGSRDIEATLNGGGVQLNISTVNGKIYLRRLETADAL